jgi:hypothetical protein
VQRSKQKNRKTDAMSRKWLVAGAVVTTAMGASAYAMRKRRNGGGDVPDAPGSDAAAQGKEVWGTAGETFSQGARDLTDPAKSASSRP